MKNSIPSEIPLELPYEKAGRLGTNALTDVELLAVLLRTGTRNKSVFETAGELLSNLPGGLRDLTSLSVPQLMKISGIGKVKALQLTAAAELAKRISRTRLDMRNRFSDPGSIAEHYSADLRFQHQEHVILICLDSQNRCIDDACISLGSVNAAIISPREIFRRAIAYNAVRIILIHNHPSGVAHPSSEDISMTMRLSEISHIMEIPLIDHIIIGDNSYFSMSEAGYLP